MKTRYILTALATASLIVGGQVIAQGRGGGQGGGQGGGHSGGHGGSMAGGHSGGHGGNMGAGRGDVGGINDRREMTGRDRREEARANSQGPINANARALERANENSVLADGSTTVPDLSGLRTGLTVVNSDGRNLGTISRISRSRDGTVRNVLVTGEEGRRRVIRVAPGTLTLNGEVVVTTED